MPEDGPDHAPSPDETLHRVQAAALGPWLTPPRGRSDAEGPLEVLEVGVAGSRWASSFDPTKTRFAGIGIREDPTGGACPDSPEMRFDLLGSELLLPYDNERFDLVFSVNLLHQHPTTAKLALLSEMCRVTRPGGRLLLLDTFVFAKRSEGDGVYPASAEQFEALILAAMAEWVVLEHAESLRYPGENLRRGGLISLTKLGVPES